MKYAIIDVETTGGQARWERITEIAIVLHDGQQVLDTFSTLLNPERSIPPFITQMTGISDDMVAHAPKFFEVAKQIVELTDDAVFVAHNVAFDYGFIREEFARLGYPFTRKQLCTVRLSRKVFPGLGSYSLSNLKRHFQIHAERSHRALDDALATAILFEKIMAAQAGTGSVKTLVNQGVRETKLPRNITLERLHALPESCGVYYLRDEQGEIVYVGKSINIRKRLFDHFADQTPKGEKMREGVADIDFEITGSELVALLLESSEIKKHQPRINRAQRITQYQGGIFSYFDQNGYRCLAPGRLTAANRKKLEIVADYPKLESAKAHLESVARQHELCLKLCNLDFHDHACFHFSLKKCHGACIGQEPPEAYNARVAEAFELLGKRLEGSFFILENGRELSERAFVCVENGRFKGYGYWDETLGNFTTEDLLEGINAMPPDPEAAKIIRGYLSGQKGVRVLPF